MTLQWNCEKKHECKRLTLVLLLLFYVLVVWMPPVNGEILPTPEEYYYDEMSVLCAHNAYTSHKNRDVVPNQNDGIGTQLSNGVRCFMLDNYYLPNSNGANDIDLCHNPFEWEGDAAGDCNHGTFTQVFNEEFIPFLQNNPNEIIVVVIEDYVESRSHYQNAFANMNNIVDYIFNPNDFSSSVKESNHWPPVSLMRSMNERLLIFTSKSSNSGEYTLSSGKVYMGLQSNWTNENDYEMGTTIFTHDYSCKKRWDPLSQETVDAPGFNWVPLFVMNHFHAFTDPTGLHSMFEDNDYNTLMNRIVHQCMGATDFSKIVNYLALDFVASLGQGNKAVRSMGVYTQGGIIFFEGNSLTQDVVCGTPLDYIGNGLELQGDWLCSNDEARSAQLINLKAGTKLSFYDSPSRSMEDDYLYLYIKKSITLDKDDMYHYRINSFESDFEDEYVIGKYFRNNGLDGKLSYVKVEQDWFDPCEMTMSNSNWYRDGVITLYEGDGGSQNAEYHPWLCIILVF